MEPDIQIVDEDRNSYYLDGLGRIWAFDDVDGRWFSPDVPMTTCTWDGVVGFALDAHGRGLLRKATPEETEEIDREMFS